MRKNVFAVVAAVGLTLALGASLAACGSQSGGSSAPANKAASTTAPIKADAQWEKVANVPNTAIIEGMNFRDDELWFIDVGTSRIFKLVNGEVETVYQDPEKRAMPNGAKFIDDNTLLITDRALGLCTYDVTTGEYTVKVSGVDGSNFLGLNDIVLDGQGGAYFTDPGQSDYLSPEGSVYYVNYGDGSYKVERYAGNFAYPNGITISPDGKFLYVAEFNTNSIVLVPSKLYTDAKDTPYVFARLNGGHGPDGVLTDEAGNVYAAHLNAGEMVAVSPNGFEIGSWQLPDDATDLVSNLCIGPDGYMYMTEFGGGNIWRIPTSAQPNPLA